MKTLMEKMHRRTVRLFLHMAPALLMLSCESLTESTPNCNLYLASGAKVLAGAIINDIVALYVFFFLLFLLVKMLKQHIEVEQCGT